MFGFMKKHSEKDKDERDKKKREKKDKKDRKQVDSTPLTQEELNRLEEVKKGLVRKRSPSDYSYTSYKQTKMPGKPEDDQTFTSEVKVDISRTVRIPPPTHPKPKSILKGRSNYGPEIPNQGVRGHLDDTVTLVENTNLNEILPGELADVVAEPKPSAPLRSSRGFASLPGTESVDNDMDSEIPVDSTVTSPSEKYYANIDLQLPLVAPPRCPKPRILELKRQPAGDFGFTLRRGSVLERGGSDEEKKRLVVFAEPGPKNLHTGLLPGDRLIEVNGINVETFSREEIIEIIKKSSNVVSLKVQPIPELAELSVRSGFDKDSSPASAVPPRVSTLKRSGSIRNKSKHAKSENQMALEKEWLQADKVWLVHKGGFASAHMVQEATPTPGEDGKAKVTVKLDYGGEVLEVDEEDVEKANPPQCDRAEDLASLRYLNESSLLHTLRQRYGSNLIHTYAGPLLLIVNPMHPLSIYSEKVIQMFKGCKPEDMPPHIYASAQKAYRDLLNSRHSQSIVLLGRSGGGKTTNARHIMHYLTVAAGSINNFLTVDKLNSIFSLLDAFGNSRTIMNTNATRYTQIVSFDFDHTGQIGSASIQVMMLEKMRIAKRPEGEPTFHIFYQMLAGIDDNIRKDLQLENMTEPNLFMTPLQRLEDRQKASQSWGKILHAFNHLSITESEVKGIMSILAAVYHLGTAGTVKGTNNKYQFGRPVAAQKAAAVLGTTVEELSRNIFSQTQARGTVTSPQSKSDEGDKMSGLEALEGFVIGLYSEAFNSLVLLINRSLTTNYRTTSSITILDGPGFQNAASCGRETGATFDDFCHNYAQERLQLLFHDIIFNAQMDLYSQENVEIDFEPLTSSPGPMVSLIDKTPSQPISRTGSLTRGDPESQKGILNLLDEEAILSSATEDSLMQRIKMVHSQSSRKQGGLFQRGNTRNLFTLNHFQGTNPVTYNTRGWLKACRENPIAIGVSTFLQDSNKPEVSSLFMNFTSGGTQVKGSSLGLDGKTSSLRRTSSMRRTFSPGGGIKRRSICLQVKHQADNIVSTLRKTKVHFVLCLLPQHNAGLSELRTSQLAPNKAVSSEDVMMNVPLVRSQVRGLEIVEAIRIHRQGYPEHMPYAEFRHRFEFLVPVEERPDAKVEDKDAVCKILHIIEIDTASYRRGLSLAFFRSGGLAHLEDMRDERLTGMIVSYQARCRGYLSRKNLDKRKLQNLAVSCIQKNVRKWMLIREWPWWRLYTKIQPVLNVHRTEEELKDREVELTQLLSKVEKLEKERAEYKQAVEALEAQLSEVTADLAEEHTTTTQATDVLEAEQAERIRLEREVRDLTSKYNVLQHKNEEIQMELYQAKMLAAELDEELDEDQADGDIYKEKYLRTRKEMEFTRKSMQQQIEEVHEQQTQLKHNMQRKITESQDEADEERKKATNAQKKCIRLAQDLADIKLHMDEQTSRNSDLEKKQRKFDHELHKITEMLNQEKLAKEKLQRERDQLLAEKITSDQASKNLQLDLELEAEKAKRLETELLEMSSSSKADVDVLTLRRQKNELDRRVQDQEEELDEQAGTIQQLEQAKLRLEMSSEKIRQQHAKEIDEKDVEIEELRASTAKRLKILENNVEEEYNQRQEIMKEKRELERKLQMQSEQSSTRDRDLEFRLRRDLKRTKALLADTQSMLQRQKDTVGDRASIKQLRNQLEDAEYAAAATLKAKKSVEIEMVDLQSQLDSISKSKAEVEARCSTLTREKNELVSRLEDVDEDYNELMKKYQAAIKQQTVDTQTIADQYTQIEENLAENQNLKEQIAQLETKCQFYQDSMVDKHAVMRLETKMRDLESRLELETTLKNRAETQLTRFKEGFEQAKDAREAQIAEENRQADALKKYERQVRELREELAESEQREEDSLQKKHDLEKKVEFLEVEFDQAQGDLKLAFKRISDLQAALADAVESDDSEEYSDYIDGMDGASDDSDFDDFDENEKIDFGEHSVSSA